MITTACVRKRIQHKLLLWYCNDFYLLTVILYWIQATCTCRRTYSDVIYCPSPSYHIKNAFIQARDVITWQFMFNILLNSRNVCVQTHCYTVIYCPALHLHTSPLCPLVYSRYVTATLYMRKIWNVGRLFDIAMTFICFKSTFMFNSWNMPPQNYSSAVIYHNISWCILLFSLICTSHTLDNISWHLTLENDFDLLDYFNVLCNSSIIMESIYLYSLTWCNYTLTATEFGLFPLLSVHFNTDVSRCWWKQNSCLNAASQWKLLTH